MVIEFAVDAKRVAAIGSNALNRQMTSDVAEAFLLVHGEELRDKLLEELRLFIVGKLK